MRRSREQRRRVRAETVAALTAHAFLATLTRNAMAVAVTTRQISPAAALRTLEDWQLLPPASGWAVTVTFRITGTQPADNTDQARSHTTGRLRRSLPTAEITALAIADVTPVDAVEHDTFRVTAEAILQIAVIAVTADQAVHTAAVQMHAAIPQLADAGMSVTNLRWADITGPDDGLLLRAARQHLTTTLPVRLPSRLSPVARRDRALADLSRLQHAIRSRLLHALASGAIHGDFQQAADRVDHFLRTAGLTPLPTAQRILVTADTTLRVQPADSDDIDYGELLPHVDPSDDQRLQPLHGWNSDTPAAIGDGRWQLRWHQEFHLWLRHDTVHTATDLVRAHLNPVLHDIDHDDLQIHVVYAAGVFDPCFDPDND
ncbi:hypothetical protein [Actinoplanes couchii]|uniref:Uncharacterized protein n=1 Tax=Actinoplanes couchii TaxID=403638 RepID=A0ABQ3XTK0_9ACTN|nr:hypothetical protein [Actinoplanes couchii]MDR6318931.1 hypothetical protein [Actinoplanes couchii]GID61839.1 hypothetical protein Aco03nite_102430 [Actinoplanes couchii]